MKDIVISLFDRTGNWSRPYLEAGYIWGLAFLGVGFASTLMWTILRKI